MKIKTDGLTMNLPFTSGYGILNKKLSTKLEVGMSSIQNRAISSKPGILIVSKGKPNSLIKKIIVAWDKYDGDELFIDHFYDILTLKETEVVFVHVNKIGDVLNNVDFQSLKKTIESLPLLNQRIRFDSIYVTDEEFYPFYMNIYMRYMRSSLLIVNFTDKTRLKKLAQNCNSNKSNQYNYQLCIL